MSEFTNRAKLSHVRAWRSGWAHCLPLCCIIFEFAYKLAASIASCPASSPLSLSSRSHTLQHFACFDLQCHQSINANDSANQIPIPQSSLIPQPAGAQTPRASSLRAEFDSTPASTMSTKNVCCTRPPPARLRQCWPIRLGAYLSPKAASSAAFSCTSLMSPTM